MPVPVCDEKGCFEIATSKFERERIIDQTDDGFGITTLKGFVDVHFCDEHTKTAEQENELAENFGRAMPYRFVGWLDELQERKP